MQEAGYPLIDTLQVGENKIYFHIEEIHDKRNDRNDEKYINQDQ